MPSNAPLVSVIIPTYNSANFLPEAVASLRAQRHAPLEIIVVDDGSTDNTARVVRELGGGLRYTYQPNGGPAAARNTGLALARGPVLGFLDADDLLAEGALAALLAPLLHDPAVEVVHGQTQVLVLRAGARVGPPRFEPFAYPFHGAFLPSLLVRRTAFEKVGLLDTTFTQSEDVDWFLRVREHGLEVALVERVVLYYRKHQTNITRKFGPHPGGMLRAFKRSLDRRRAGRGGMPGRLPAWGSAAPHARPGQSPGGDQP